MSNSNNDITAYYTAASILITLGGVALTFMPIVNDIGLRLIYAVFATILMVIGASLFLIARWKSANIKQ
ncbi:MAG: hypothetical protein KatS3mg003_1433 [Candidatus Nitrosocaldaceae archaeon]|nr:MAG: hypothetical protein KatS3mg003_1433 [Candidatus Nitrosocaldaceae archaeon]